MVIRVSKPEINLRDKLSKLELPVGPYGSSLMRSDDKMEAARIVGVGRKNMIRNGNFIINQKAPTFTNISSGHIFDGWYMHDSTNGSIAATITEATPYPPECSKYLQVQCTGTDTNLSSGQYVSLACSIEGFYFEQAKWGTRHAKDLTLSFYHRHTRPGVYSGCFRNVAANINYVFEYTQEQGDTWELAECIIIGEQTSSWPTGNGKALNLNWSLADESSVSDTPGKWFSGQYYHGSTRQINFMTSTSNYFRITAVQLEVGKSKTPFDDIGFQAMQDWCERYYEIHWQNTNTNNPAGSHNDGYNALCSGGVSGSKAYFPFKYRTQKRANPTISYGGKFRISGGGGAGSNKTPDEFYSPSIDGCRIRLPQSGGSNGDGCWLEFDGANSSAGYLSIDCQL